MASVTQSSAALPLHSGASATIRIEPPRGLFELRLREVWVYRELLYFFVWRDVKIRYKQTAIGVLWVVLQPVLTMLVFTLFFVRLPMFTAAYGLRPTLAALWLPALLTLAVFTALGVGLWLSALNALYRDVRYVIPFVIQFWMFASPVAYPSTLVPARWRWLYGLNPMAGVIDGFRWAITGRGQPPGLLLLASAFAVALVVLGGLFFFNRMESSVADRV